MQPSLVRAEVLATAARCVLSASVVWAALQVRAQGAADSGNDPAGGARLQFSVGACYDSPPSLFSALLAKLALDEGYFDDALPGTVGRATFTVTVSPADTRCSGTLAAKAVLPLLLGKGTKADQMHADNVSTPPVVAIAGCACSPATRQVAGLAAAYQVPVVSGASSDPRLSDRQAYPWFSRVIPSDAGQASVWAALVRVFGWRRIVTLVPDEYPGQALQEAFTARLARDHIQFVDFPLPPQISNVTMLQELAAAIAQERPRPRIFFTAASTRLIYLVRVFRDSGFVGPTNLWVLSELACSVRALTQLGNESINKSADMAAGLNDSWWDYPWNDTAKYIRGMLCPTMSNRGPEFSAARFQSILSRLTESSFQSSSWPLATWDGIWSNTTWWQDARNSALEFDAMAAIILAIGSLLGRGTPAAQIAGAALLGELRAVRWVGLSGLVALDASGDRLGSYVVRNLRLGARDVLPSLDGAGLYDGFRDSVAWTSLPVFADGTTDPPRDRPDPCSPGLLLDSTGAGCVGCPAGRVFRNSTGQAACVCPSGSYGGASATEQCAPCSAGWFAAEVGYTACASCAAGFFADGGGMSACRTAPPGTYAANSAATAAIDCPVGTFSARPGQDSCEACPPGSFRSSPGGTSCERCDRGSYLMNGECKPCGLFTATNAAGAMAQDTCRLTGGGGAFVAACSLLGVFILTAIFLFLRRQRRRAAAYEREREQRALATVEAGLLAVRQLGHPMVLIRSADFLSLTWGQLGCMHEGVRNMGKLLILDTLEHVNAARDAGMAVVFFSYQWASWDRHGPNVAQFQRMKEAVVTYGNSTRGEMSKLCIWLDVLAIPQCHDGVKRLAIESLYTYATVADALIIIAPDCIHDNTNTAVNLETYKSRVWTRAEQVAHLSCHGVSTMLVATPTELVPVTKDWVRDILCIFEAEMTCCRLKHRGMTRCDRESLVVPLLGLWYILSAPQTVSPLLNARGGHSGGGLLYTLIQPQLRRVFPPTYEYVTEWGSQRRELFGDCIERVERLVRKQAKLRAAAEEREPRSIDLILPADFCTQASRDMLPAPTGIERGAQQHVVEAPDPALVQAGQHLVSL